MSKSKLVVRSQWGNDDVEMYHQRFDDGTLYLSLWCDEGPYADLTLCFDMGKKGKKDRDGYGYVDTNNCPWGLRFIKEYGLGEWTGMSHFSGFCEYPLFKFNMDRIAELSTEMGA